MLFKQNFSSKEGRKKLRKIYFRQKCYPKLIFRTNVPNSLKINSLKNQSSYFLKVISFKAFLNSCFFWWIERSLALPFLVFWGGVAAGMRAEEDAIWAQFRLDRFCHPRFLVLKRRWLFLKEKRLFLGPNTWIMNDIDLFL